MGTASIHKIDEELVCVESLYNFLQNNKRYHEIIIEREPQDPPDFWLTVSGDKFAVEVTSIVDDLAYDARCIYLVEAITKKCKAANCLRGLYGLTVVGRPDIPKRLSRRWEELISETQNYISITIENNASGEKCIFNDKDGYLAIEKLSGKGASVALGGPVTVRWEGESQVKLLELFGAALEKKRNAFLRKGMLSNSTKIILIFYDAFGFCSMSEARSVFNNTNNYEWLHSAYWAASFVSRANSIFPHTPGRNGCFLFSKNKDWQA